MYTGWYLGYGGTLLVHTGLFILQGISPKEIYDLAMLRKTARNTHHFLQREVIKAPLLLGIPPPLLRNRHTSCWFPLGALQFDVCSIVCGDHPRQCCSILHHFANKSTIVKHCLIIPHHLGTVFDSVQSLANRHSSAQFQSMRVSDVCHCIVLSAFVYVSSLLPLVLVICRF